MYQRILALLFLMAAAAALITKASQLFLAFYVLFPMLFFPVIYFYDHQHRRLFWTALALTAGLYFFFLFKYPAPEMVLLGIGTTGLLGALRALRLFWQRHLAQSEKRMLESRKDLAILKEKYQVRLDNLNRLEKQVLSLMEIFEIARDFSGALKVEVLCKLICEKVLPVLPFKKMRLFIAAEGEVPMAAERGFGITEAGVSEESTDLSAADRAAFAQAFERSGLFKPDGSGAGECWVFPLLIEGKPAGIVEVAGADADDLVKFEVLASQLVLQVRKIRLYETVLRLSIIDGLTGVYVRRYFMDRMAEELRRSIKFGLPLSVLMLDIDHFKRYNDEFGHLAGDETLKKVAALIRRSLRKVDIVARYGGEEFVAVIPESRAAKAHEVAERIRSEIARHDFKIYDHDTKVTVSIGVSTFPEDVFKDAPPAYYDDLAFDLIRHADKALYRAKEEGRNRVFVYRDLSVKGV